MFNGHHTHDNVSVYNSSSNTENITRASLSNLLNTCYLNSVLYMLRFTPGFTRKIHHLVTDLQQISTVLNQNKHKSSSLGRNIQSLSGASSRSNSSKDLLSLGNSRNDVTKADFHLIVEELHDLYLTMHKMEVRESSEPLGPTSFKLAFVKKYKAFSGNQQQDAHEFLMCLLSAIGDTCQLMVRKKTELRDRENNGSIRINDKSQKDTKSFCARKIRKIIVSKDSPPQQNGKVNDPLDLSQLTPICKFVEDDFEGVSVQRTKCLECENVTERKEVFRDLCIPISDAGDAVDAVENIFRLACVTSEYLIGTNKYYCENCLRHNIARREVCYQKLPRILIFQLKRFMSSSSGTTEKINHFMPTPMFIPCFCEECCASENQAHDNYTLYSVIMHKGTTMAAGHYVCYVKDLTNYDDYLNCPQDGFLPGVTNDSKPTNNRLVEFFRTKSSVDSDDPIIPSKNASMTSICRSLQCCSIKSSKSSMEQKHKEVWLECNDESVRSLSVKELESQLLDHKNVISTPYLLFYVRGS